MLANFLQRLIRWMPLILLLLLFMINRNNTFQKIGYIILLFSYTGVLILRILYAKQDWHKEFSTGDLAKDSKINKIEKEKEMAFCLLKPLETFGNLY